MSECSTRVDSKTVENLVQRIGKLAADTDPKVREAVAVALGRFGSPRGRKTLAVLERDAFDAGGQVCTSKNGGPQICRPNRPVALAAREALDAIDQADKARAEQRAERKRSSR
jgi:hypothetical protein